MTVEETYPWEFVDFKVSNAEVTQPQVLPWDFVELKISDHLKQQAIAKYLEVTSQLPPQGMDKVEAIVEEKISKVVNSISEDGARAAVSLIALTGVLAGFNSAHETPAPRPTTIEHVVKAQNETLVSLARDYATTPALIAEANRDIIPQSDEANPSTVLKPGLDIKIPVNKANAATLLPNPATQEQASTASTSVNPPEVLPKNASAEISPANNQLV